MPPNPIQLPPTPQNPMTSKLILLGAAQVAGAYPVVAEIIHAAAPSLTDGTTNWIASALIGVLTIVFRVLTNQPIGLQK